MPIISRLWLIGALGCIKAPAVEAPMENAWTIESNGVGVLRIGEPVPLHLHGAAGPGYYARYIGDGQPDEGFVLDAPKVDVGIRGGPFAEWVDEEGGQEPPVEQLRAQLAPDSLKISRLSVHDSAPRTAQGTGVGSTLQALQAAYADLKTSPVPPTRGDDLCVARSASLPGVYFLFQSCEAARNGARVLRVDLRTE